MNNLDELFDKFTKILTVNTILIFLFSYNFLYSTKRLSKIDLDHIRQKAAYFLKKDVDDASTWDNHLGIASKRKALFLQWIVEPKKTK